MLLAAVNHTCYLRENCCKTCVDFHGYYPQRALLKRRVSKHCGWALLGNMSSGVVTAFVWCIVAKL